MIPLAWISPQGIVYEGGANWSTHIEGVLDLIVNKAVPQRIANVVRNPTDKEQIYRASSAMIRDGWIRTIEEGGIQGTLKAITEQASILEDMIANNESSVWVDIISEDGDTLLDYSITVDYKSVTEEGLLSEVFRAIQRKRMGLSQRRPGNVVRAYRRRSE